MACAYSHMMIGRLSPLVAISMMRWTDRVHGAEHVDARIVFGRVIVDGTRGIVGADPRGHGHMVGTKARLVAQRPVDDAGVILVALDQAHGAVDKGRFPDGILGEAIPDAVGLDVGLIAEQDAVFVAELVPARHAGVVGGAHGVEVELLEQPDIAHHVGFAHHVAVIRIVLVAVDALDLQGYAVEAERTVDQFDLAKADATALALRSLFRRRPESQPACRDWGTHPTTWPDRRSPGERTAQPPHRLLH